MHLTFPPELLNEIKTFALTEIKTHQVLISGKFVKLERKNQNNLYPTIHI